jgi:hypothetical protein
LDIFKALAVPETFERKAVAAAEVSHDRVSLILGGFVMPRDFGIDVWHATCDPFDFMFCSPVIRLV